MRSSGLTPVQHTGGVADSWIIIIAGIIIQGELWVKRREKILHTG